MIPDRSFRHPLGERLVAAAGGAFPPADGEVEVVPPYLPGVEAVVALTGHAVVATTLSRARLLGCGADGFGGATLPAVVLALAGPGGEIDTLDVLLVARGTGTTELPELPVAEAAGHPRVAHSLRWRERVRVFADDRGLVTLTAGVGGLPELAFEVEPRLRGQGRGRALLADALGLVPERTPVLAAVAPGNAASLRTVLASGFVPVGSVQLVRPGPDRTRG